MKQPQSGLRNPSSTPAKLVVIAGQTATGKSTLALQLAQQYDGEIIAADSWTVREGLDVGTAKPRSAERTQVPHHLLDIVGPCDDFSAAVFKRMALEAIDDIAGRGKLPIMVGGTGLYVDSVLFDYSFQPPPPSELRAELKQKSTSELLDIIEKRGLDTTGIDTRNHRRLMRLIETDGAEPTSREHQRANTLTLGLHISRSRLRQRIEKRVEVMFKRGLKYEVKELAERYGWDCEALKGIGYREWHDYFAGGQSLQATKRKIIKSTLELAKRQRTWFKRNREIIWVEDPAEAHELVADFLA